MLFSQAGFELEILLLPPPKCQDNRHMLPQPVQKNSVFLFVWLWFSETVFLVAQAGIQLVAISLPQSPSRCICLQRSPGPSLTIGRTSALIWPLL